MRPRTVLLTLVPTLAAASIAPSASAIAKPPGWSYSWAQPNTPTRIVPYAQPPAWVHIAPAWTTITLPTTSYVWAQPGGRLVQVHDAQPPAWVHIVP
ncbi:MAG TPA: hypothetical protein VIU86_12175 [Gaiellaceae bacterium]